MIGKKTHAWTVLAVLVILQQAIGSETSSVYVYQTEEQNIAKIELVNPLPKDVSATIEGEEHCVNDTNIQQEGAFTLLVSNNNLYGDDCVISVELINKDKVIETIVVEFSNSDPAKTLGQYKVRKGDTLGNIVEEYRTVSTYKHNVLAFYTYNKDKFINGDIDTLQVGSTIKIPPPEYVLNLPSESRNKPAIVNKIQKQSSVESTNKVESKEKQHTELEEVRKLFKKSFDDLDGQISKHSKAIEEIDKSFNRVNQSVEQSVASNNALSADLEALKQQHQRTTSAVDTLAGQLTEEQTLRDTAIQERFNQVFDDARFTGLAESVEQSAANDNALSADLEAVEESQLSMDERLEKIQSNYDAKLSEIESQTKKLLTINSTLWSRLKRIESYLDTKEFDIKTTENSTEIDVQSLYQKTDNQDESDFWLYRVANPELKVLQLFTTNNTDAAKRVVKSHDSPLYIFDTKSNNVHTSYVITGTLKSNAEIKKETQYWREKGFEPLLRTVKQLQRNRCKNQTIKYCI